MRPGLRADLTEQSLHRGGDCTGLKAGVAPAGWPRVLLRGEAHRDTWPRGEDRIVTVRRDGQAFGTDARAAARRAAEGQARLQEKPSSPMTRHPKKTTLSFP